MTELSLMLYVITLFIVRLGVPLVVVVALGLFIGYCQRKQCEGLDPQYQPKQAI